MELSYTIAILVLAFVSSASSAKLKLNKLIKVCSRSDPNLSECATKSGQDIIEKFANGIREYGMLPMDPLTLPFMEMSQAEKSIGLKLNISNTTHRGIRDAKVNDIKIDLKTNNIVVDLKFPHYMITGICDIGGKILLLPIAGHGFCNLTALELHVKITIDGSIQKKKGAGYYHIDKFEVKIIDSKAAFTLTGLFGGNKQLGDTMNRFLNENSSEVINEMKGTLEAVFSDLFQALLTRLFQNVPYNDLLAP